MNYQGSYFIFSQTKKGSSGKDGSSTEVQSAYQFSNFVMERHSLVIEVIIEHHGDARVGEYISISLKILHVSDQQLDF